MDRIYTPIQNQFEQANTLESQGLVYDAEYTRHKATLATENLVTSAAGMAAAGHSLARGLGRSLAKAGGADARIVAEGASGEVAAAEQAVVLDGARLGPETSNGQADAAQYAKLKSAYAMQDAGHVPLSTGPEGFTQLRASLQATTDQALADLSANPELARGLMSPGSYDHLVNGTSLAPASFGKAMERLTARYIQSDPTLSNQFEYLSRPFLSTPDFVGTVSDNAFTFDITTDASVASHLSRPYGRGATYITYPGMPQGLSFPQ
jgi:hypothetical protein